VNPSEEVRDFYERTPLSGPAHKTVAESSFI
jgi:hypothetical protein